MWNLKTLVFGHKIVPGHKVYGSVKESMDFTKPLDQCVGTTSMSMGIKRKQI